MEKGRDSNQPTQATPKLSSCGKTLDRLDRSYTTDHGGDITRKLRDSPWLLTDDQLLRTPLSKLSKGLGAVPSHIIFDAYLRWLEVQRTAPKNNFNSDWTGVIAQWTQSLRARGFTLDELIKKVGEWSDSHNIANKFVKELNDFEATARTGVRPREPPTPDMLERGWARILEGAAGSKMKGCAGTAGESSKPSAALSKRQNLSCPTKDSSRLPTSIAMPITSMTPTTNLSVLPNGWSWQRARVGPTRDKCKPLTTSDKQRLPKDITLDSLLPSKTFHKQKALDPVRGTCRPLTARNSPELTAASLVDPQKPPANEEKPQTSPTRGSDTDSPILPSTPERAPADSSGNPHTSLISRATPWGNDKYVTKVSYHNEPTPSLIKPLTPVPTNYICNRCQNPGHYVADCPTNMDPSYDRAPDITYVCLFCKKAGVHFNLFCPKNRTAGSLHLLRLAKGIVDEDGVPIRRGLEMSRGVDQHRNLVYPPDSDSNYGEISQPFGLYRGSKRPCMWEVPKRKPPTLKDGGRLSFQLSSDDELESSVEAQKLISCEVSEHKGSTVDGLKDNSTTADRFSTQLPQPNSTNSLDASEGVGLGESLNQIVRVPNVNSERPISAHAEFLDNLLRNPSQVTTKRRPRLTALDMWDISDAKKLETMEAVKENLTECFTDPILLLQRLQSQMMTTESLEALMPAGETPEGSQEDGLSGNYDLISDVLKYLSEGK